MQLNPSAFIQETGTLLAWVVFLGGGGVAYGKLSAMLEDVRKDVTQIKCDLKEFTGDYANFKSDTKVRLGAIRRSQNEDENSHFTS